MFRKIHVRLLFIFSATVCLALTAQRAHATFSIVAIDTLTGAVGGAGASCIANSVIITDVVESLGAAHTQSFWLQENKDSLHARMIEGLSPDSALGWMVANDFQGLPQDRQYIMVTLAGPGASAAFTGVDNGNFKGDLTGFGYAIAGNVLNSLDVLDDMETAFLLTDGPLEEKLMAALQGAKRPGADIRCTPQNKSAISAFIKVIYPGNGATPYLFENVSTTSGSTDPIDVLQNQFDAWKLAQQADPVFTLVTVEEDSLPASGAATTTVTVTPRNSTDQAPSKGVTNVTITLAGAGTLGPITDNGNGTWSTLLTTPTVSGNDEVIVEVEAGGVVTPIAASPDLYYYLCGDADATGAVNIADVTYLIARIFAGGSAPKPDGAGDANGSGGVNIADATYLIARIFSGGTAPVCPM